MLLNAVYAYQFNVKATGSFVSNMYANDVETKDASYTRCASRFADENAWISRRNDNLIEFLETF